MSSPPEQKHKISCFEAFHLKIKMIYIVQIQSLICHITPLSNNTNLIRNFAMTHYLSLWKLYESFTFPSHLHLMKTGCLVTSCHHYAVTLITSTPMLSLSLEYNFLLLQLQQPCEYVTDSLPLLTATFSLLSMPLSPTDASLSWAIQIGITVYKKFLNNFITYTTLFLLFPSLIGYNLIWYIYF